MTNDWIRLCRWGALLIIIAAGVAHAAGPTCVTACQDKANSCAQKCDRVAEVGIAKCQMTCAKTLFVPCVTRCQQDNVVVSDDYRVVVPGAVEPEAKEAEAEETAPEE